MRSNVLTLVLGTTGVLLLAACGGSTSPYGGGGGGGGGGCTPTATKVCMETVTFNPASLTVAAGTSVTWQNGTSVTHTVTSDAGSTQTYDSGNVGSAGTFTLLQGVVRQRARDPNLKVVEASLLPVPCLVRRESTGRLRGGSDGQRIDDSGAAQLRPPACTQAVGFRRWRRRDHDLVEGERGPAPVYHLDHRARIERLLEDYDGRVAELACPVDRADGCTGNREGVPAEQYARGVHRADGCTGNREGVPAEQYARGVQADGSSLQNVAPSIDTHDTRLRGRGWGARN